MKYEYLLTYIVNNSSLAVWQLVQLKKKHMPVTFFHSVFNFIEMFVSYIKSKKSIYFYRIPRFWESVTEQFHETDVFYDNIIERLKL